MGSVNSENTTTSERRRRRGEGEGEVGLLRAVIERGGGFLQAAEIARGGDEGAQHMGPRAEAIERDAVLRTERDPCSGERCGDCPVDSRQAADRLAHRLSAIEREDDLVVALGLVFLGIEPGVAGG